MSLASTACAQDQVCIEGHCFDVQVARTSAQHQLGLQHVQTLPGDQGMLFVFKKEGHHRFWMKDTLIPLDIIWLDADRRIKHILHNVQPCTKDLCPVYAPPVRAQCVLELNAGTANLLDLGLGAVAIFHMENNDKNIDN